MKYIFSFLPAHQRFVSIVMEVNGPFADHAFELQLPAWRPGRYETGNFAKNIKDFSVVDEHGKPLFFTKKSKDRWLIEGRAQTAFIRYRYYASQWDAGACYLDHGQLYINPVHCCFYVPGREEEPCTVQLKVPENWKVASGMRSAGIHELYAPDFHALADSPFIASPSLSHAQYTLGNLDFHIWIQGDAHPDWPRIIRDFEAFTEAQLATMKEFPSNDYHFLIQLLPFPFYHGVEHLNSTVLALGPGYKLMQPDQYKELLGVASHELFHSWNVKSIRPAEMLPYDYTRENYAETGYVYEGVTTYYGDLFLARAGCFNLQALLDEYSVRLQKHMDNPGRFNYSVAESSFDTWLDGYVPGVPGRKTSIYDEGCLLAWILDFMIRSATSSGHSLDDVMRVLYFDYAKKQKGYTGTDYREIAEMAAGRSFRDFFSEYVYKAASLEHLLGEVVSLAGLRIRQTPAASGQERQWGMKTELRNGQTFVTSVYPGSPAAEAGLMKDDELIAIDGTRIENNLSELIVSAAGRSRTLLLASSRKTYTVTVTSDDRNFYARYTIEPEESCTQGQLLFRQQWLKP